MYFLFFFFLYIWREENYMPWFMSIERNITLKREPIDENLADLLEDLFVSSGSGGKSPAIKEHLDANNKSWCSGTT